MTKKRPLGRGLGALIDGAEKEQLEKKVEPDSHIPVDRIDANPWQPRTRFDEEALAELAASVRELGIVQPLTVRAAGEGRYQLIAGERRLRAAKMAGLKTVPAFVRTADDQAMLELALVENIQREDLDSIEVAISYRRLMEECTLTQDQLSERVGKQRSTISNYLRLLKLPPEIQLGIRNSQISMGHARTLITVDDPKEQIEAYYKIVDEELSVRQTEELVRRIGAPPVRDPQKREKRKEITAGYSQLEEHLKGLFSTDVALRVNEKGKGKIVIQFGNSSEMEHIIQLFDKLNG